MKTNDACNLSQPLYDLYCTPLFFMCSTLPTGDILWLWSWYDT